MSGCEDTLDALPLFDHIVKESDEWVEDSPAVLAAVTELDLERGRRPSTPINIPLECPPEYQHSPAPNSRTSTQSPAGRLRSPISSFQSGVLVAQLDKPFYIHKNLNNEEPQGEGLSQTYSNDSSVPEGYDRQPQQQSGNFRIRLRNWAAIFPARPALNNLSASKVSRPCLSLVIEVLRVRRYSDWN